MKAVRSLVSRSLVIGLVVFSLGLSARPTEMFVNSPRDLRTHFALHIQRVKVLALDVYDRHPEIFADLPRELVEEFIGLHDRTKIDHSRAFRRRFWVEAGVSRPEPFPERLYEFYGRGYDLPKVEGERLNVVRNELNASDRAVALDFFRRHKLLTPEGKPNRLAELMQRLEKIADVADRSRDPVALEEFGLTERRPVSDFLKDPRDLALALEVTDSDAYDRYAFLTRGLRFSVCRRPLQALR